MQARNACLLFVCLGVFGAFLGGAAPAEAQTLCGFVCDCDSACTDPCTRFIIIGGEPHEVETTCGAHGVCNTDPECNGCIAQDCTHFIYGTSANNTLTGTANKECIWGYDGNDTLDGDAGDDWIWGGNGTDTLYGDSGNDCLYGEADNDHLDGQSGTDHAEGQGGTDTCYAESEVACEL